MPERAADPVTGEDESMGRHRWTPTTDAELTDAEAAALDSILGQIVQLGGGAATGCGYADDGRPLGSVTIAHVGELTVGVVVRNEYDEHEVIVCSMEPA